MPVKLLTSGGGGVNLVPSSSIASDQTMYLPTSGTSGGTVLCTDSTGGTANGVLYLNSSKQVTSGSGLVFDSSGNLLVGTSYNPARFNVASAADTMFVQTTGTSYTCSYWRIGSDTNCYYSLFQNVSGSNIGWIRTTDGSTVSYYTGSDVRLKTNISESENALEKLNTISVKSYDWIASGQHVDYGFIAQELYEVSPDAVSVGRDKEDGSIDIPWGVENSKLVPMLVKAVQEQQAIIESLTQRIEALEYTKQGE